MVSFIKFLFSGKAVIIWIPLFLILIFFIQFDCKQYWQFGSDTTIIYKEINILVPDSTYLFSVDSLKVPQNDLSVHNKYLISTLQGRELLHRNSIESQVESQRQTRTIYVLIIGIILTVVLKMFGNKSKKKEKKKFFIIFLLTILIILFYFLDVHQEDLIIRSNKTREMTSVALDTLVSQKQNDTTWYLFDYNERDSLIFDSLSASSRNRKIYAMFQLPLLKTSQFPCNLIQVGFYIIPLFIVYISFIIVLYNKNKTTKKNIKPNEN